MAATAAAHAPSTTTLAHRLAAALRRERTLFRAGAAVLALHVVVRTLIAPWPGTPASDHLVSAAVPVALLALAAWAYPRLPGVLTAAAPAWLGVLGIVAAGVANHYAGAAGLSGPVLTGLLALPAGAMLIGLGATVLWRTRRTDGNRAWRYGRRLLLAVAGVAFVSVVMMPLGVAYVTTHAGRAVVPPDRLGVAHEDVRFTTSDGLTLHGWYIPSRNRAAVISFPGRNGPQRQARMLARHGYGVLLFDRRGEGRSDGQPNTWGWSGERDVKAAIAWLQRRPDVDPDRIGGIGLSVGGEMMLEAAAETDALRAVVSEGAGARAFADELDHDYPNAVERVLAGVTYGVRTAAVGVFANQTPPRKLEDLVGRIAPRPLLLINVTKDQLVPRILADAVRSAGEPKELWEIPESRHVGGIVARPAEYERRVIAFLDGAL